MSYDLRVDPERLVVVRYDDPAAGPAEVLAIACRYAPVVQEGGRRIAIEVLWDPAEQAPHAPYYCPRERLARRLVEPARVLAVRPYAG
jgi:hypothetical protein